MWKLLKNFFKSILFRLKVLFSAIGLLWKIVLGVWTFLGFLDLLESQFLSPDTVSKIPKAGVEIMTLWHLLSFQSWILILVMLLFFAQLEFSASKQKKLEELEIELIRFKRPETIIKLAESMGMLKSFKTEPRQVFKDYLKKKIEQGEMLFKSDLKDEPTAEDMDFEQFKKFREFYNVWEKDIFGAFSLAFGPEHNLTMKIGDNEMTYGNYRTGLEENIKYLRHIEKEVKTDWFESYFKPELLKEYDEFKFP